MTENVLIFDPLMIQSYGGTNQDIAAQTSIEDDGKTLTLLGNGWKKINYDYTITADTILEFDFKSSREGEIHGIGFDNDNMLNSTSLFKLYGTQDWAIRDFDNYQDPTGETWTHYKIRVGDFFTGDVSYLTFANDHDVSNSEAESIFSNIKIYEYQDSVEPPTVVDTNTIKSTNIMKNGSFITTNSENSFNSNWGTTYSTDAGKGWIVPKSHKWNLDGANQWADADNTGAGGLIQVIGDNQITQGLQAIHFDATNLGSNNILRLQIYGVDGEFKMGNWNTNAPVTVDDSTINVVTLLDTNNIATEEFDWKTFSWDSVDFGSGYEYIALRFWTNGVDETEFQAIDNVVIQSIATNNPLVAVDDSFTTDQNTSTTIVAADLLSNDDAPDGDTLSLISVDNNINGTVYLDNNEDVIFTPDADFSGTASFDYTVSDGNGGIDTATVTLEVKVPAFSKPQAYDDHFVTQKNKSLTILGSDLLANDLDTNGQTLRITEVTNASDGTVTLDSQGNIFFNPDADFAGVTSFDYMIQNEQGLLSDATVTVNVTNDVALGTNLNGINDWSTQVPFIDRFKSSRQWITQTDGVWNTKENHLLDLDENGWVKSLPALEDVPQYNYVSTIFTNLDQGRYIVLYDGEGEIQYSNQAIDQASSIDGRDVINIGSNQSLTITIAETDPNQTVDYLRNIRLIPEAYESRYETETFNPTFLETTQPYHTLRFMDWMKTNHSTQGEWSERPTLEDSTWSTLGAPVEVMVELANTLDVDPWFTMPHMATDEYVTNFATYVRDNLEPERTVYVEYSNEVWNWQFTQARWVDQQAKNDPNFNGNWMNWFGKRTTEITEIWDQVFEETGQKERVMGVMAAQAANRWTAQQALNYDSWSTENKTHADYGIDAIAIAPYFGGYLGKNSNQAEVETWTLDQLFDELTQGGVISDGPTGGALQKAYDNMANYADLAQQEGLELLAYEGGQHLVGHGGVENNQTITDLFIAANSDPRMGELYKEYFSNWYQQGGGLFMHFTDVGEPSKWGSWGTLESIDEAGSPKYDALMDLVNNGIETAQ